MYCKRCGAQVDDSSRFCPSCGFELFQPDAAKGFILACWNGEKSLAFTYWVIWFIPGFISNVLYKASSYNGWEESLGPIGFLFYATAIIAFFVFQCVSLWRSAERYAGRAVWKMMAKGLVVLSIAKFILVEFILFLSELA